VEYEVPDNEFSKSVMLETDILQLQDLFPDIQTWDIRHALLEANGIVAIALDTLLSVQYLRSATAQNTAPDALSTGGDTKVEPLGGSYSIYGYDAAGTIDDETSMSDPKTLKSESILMPAISTVSY
jgi:hypothetical protein